MMFALVVLIGATLLAAPTLLAAAASNPLPPDSCKLAWRSPLGADADAASCWEWDLSAVTAHSWPVNTSTCPRDCNAFFVANPCALATVTACKPGLGSDKPAPAYQVSNKDHSCYALGSLTHPTFSPLPAGAGASAPPRGVRLEFHGGDAGRSFAYELTCNDNDQGGPDVGAGIVETHEMYTVQWAHKAFCPRKLGGGGQCPPSLPPNPHGPGPSPPGPTPGPSPAPAWGSVPVPTPAQLAYYRSEMRALIHFNMATFIRDGDPGCSAENWNTHKPYAAGLASDPATFDPKLLNFSQWIEIMQVVGIQNAVMTAKHGCGHLLWPTQVKLPDNVEYTYCVGKKDSAVKFDLIKEYAKAMRANNMAIGFYYSLTNNYFMNVGGKVARGESGWLPGMAEGVNQTEFERIAYAQLSELWQNYGKRMMCTGV